MKPIFIITLLAVSSMAYLAGFVSGVKKYFPFGLAQSINNEFNKPMVKRVFGWDVCEVKKLLDLPPTFSVVVGHAYGAPSNLKLNSFIAPNVENFLLKHALCLNLPLFDCIELICHFIQLFSLSHLLQDQLIKLLLKLLGL